MFTSDLCVCPHIPIHDPRPLPQIIPATPNKQDGSESRCDVDFSLLKAHVCGVKDNGGKGKDRGSGAAGERQ